MQPADNHTNLRTGHRCWSRGLLITLDAFVRGNGKQFVPVWTRSHSFARRGPLQDPPLGSWSTEDFSNRQYFTLKRLLPGDSTTPGRKAHLTPNAPVHLLPRSQGCLPLSSAPCHCDTEIVTEMSWLRSAFEWNTHLSSLSGEQANGAQRISVHRKNVARLRESSSTTRHLHELGICRGKVLPS